MTKIKKILLILLAFVLSLGLVLSGIFLIRKYLLPPSVPPADMNVTLEYWGVFEPPQVMYPLIKKYQKTHPKVTINYTQRTFEDDFSRYRGTLLTRLKEGSGPDIMRVHSTWIPAFYNELSPVDSSISLEDFTKRFYPVAKDQCVTTSGQILCIPLMYDGLVLLYNRDMFNAEGLTVPESWDELREDAIKLTKRTREQVTRGGAALGTASNVSNSSDILGLMLLQSGVKIPDAFDSAAAVSAVTFYTNFFKADKVWDDAMPDSIVAFAAQKTAMAFGNSWQILEVLSLNPTLNFAAAPVPQLPNADGTLTKETLASFWVETVSADSDPAKKKAAWDFLNWLSQPEQQVMLYSEESKYRRFGEIYSDVSLMDNIKTTPYIGAIVQQAPWAVALQIADQSGNDKYVDVMNWIIDQILAGKEPLKTLQTAKQNYVKLK